MEVPDNFPLPYSNLIQAFAWRRQMALPVQLKRLPQCEPYLFITVVF
jgi:hypothetical protein